MKSYIAFFASEKFKNILLNLSPKIYMKVHLLVDINTSVGLQVNSALVEFFLLNFCSKNEKKAEVHS